MLQKHRLYLSILIIMDYSLFSSWYMAFGSGVYDIWILFGYGIYLMALHHVALHCTALAYGVMSWTYGSDRTGTALFIGHNDAASYLVGYEGRSSYASMCIHYWFGIEMQLHTLMGMKAGVSYAFICFTVWFWWLDVMKHIAIYYEWLCLTLCYGLSDFGYTICGLYEYSDIGLM